MLLNTPDDKDGSLYATAHKKVIIHLKTLFRNNKYDVFNDQ